MGTEVTNNEAIARAVGDRFAVTLARLGALVRIPSVSAASFDRDPLVRSAEAVADEFRALRAFDTVNVVTAERPDGDQGAPGIIARRAARNGRPTVMLYAHHDVQPPGPNDQWSSAAFEPTVRDGRLYGRGAADDKAGIACHLAAIEAFMATSDDPQLGITVFIEGEEESGSPSFGDFLSRYRDELAADVIVIADSVNWSVDVPSLTVSLRGNITLTVTVSTLDHSVHSGMYGGAVPDAMTAMIGLLASLHDADGALAVPGLVADDRDVPAYDEGRLRAESSLREGVASIGRGPVLSRLWDQPAVTVTGIDAPSVATASNTLAASTRARLSVRVAPSQSAEYAFAAITRHLRSRVPFGARLEVGDVDLGEGFVVTEGAATEAMRASMRQAWGADPVDMGIGGSIPFVAQLVEKYPDAAVLITGVEDPDTRAHSPNESLHLGVFRRAVLTEADFLARLNSRVG